MRVRCVPLKCLIKLCVFCVLVLHGNIRYPQRGADIERRLAGLSVSVVNWHFVFFLFLSLSLSLSVFLPPSLSLSPGPQGGPSAFPL